jgi:hypothetical protein
MARGGKGRVHARCAMEQNAREISSKTPVLVPIEAVDIRPDDMPNRHSRWHGVSGIARRNP